MSEAFVNKLLKSFDKLENCIAVTEDVLKQKPDVPSDVLERINQYNEIVSKQRDLAHALRQHIAEQNWDEVGRHVRLINGFSSMIRDDAQQILDSNGSFEYESAVSAPVC